MTTLIVYAGPNGSGKSSVRDARQSPVEVVIDPDRIAREINPAAPRSVDREAGERAVRLFGDTVAAGRSLSMETTLTGRSAMRRMEQAKAAGYEVLLVYVALNDPELNVARVAERARLGGHGIEPETVRRRVGRSLDNLSRAIAIADHSIVFDNSGVSHRRVLETAGGRISHLAQDLPGWLETRMPEIAGALQAQRVAAGVPPAPGTSPPAVRPRSLTSLLNSLRPAEPETRKPWEPAPIPVAERVQAFEKAAERKAAEARTRTPQPPEPDQQSNQPKPSSGPGPS